MRWLNYHHLFYFWMVAKQGSVTAAAQDLRLAQPTLSAQLKSLERSLGEKLLTKSGRGLVLTETGKIVQRYCEQIFSLGNEMFELIEGRAGTRPELLRVGISDVLPKTLVYRILEPLFALERPPRLVVEERTAERLLADLAIHILDVVISDCPIPPSVNVRAYNHLLGECGVTFLAAPALQRRWGKQFPRSLDGAPLVFPSTAAAVRQELDRWFLDQQIVPLIVAELEDSALMKIFARQGRGIVPVPTPVADEVAQEYSLKAIGRIDEPLQRFYLISTEKRLRHAGIAQLWENARKGVFSHS